MAFISNSDFIGKFNIVTDGFEKTDLDLYCARYETILLVELLGKELYDLWIADLEEVVPNPIYKKLEEAFIEQTNCGQIFNSTGVKDMLLGFIYFNWLRDGKVRQTANGGTKVISENSERSGLSDLFQRYNESIDTYKAIQGYIMENLDVYPTFKGVEKSYSYMAW